jgi:S-DNA-T family DNA segregation ATPase FtsK/SpoIIIE
MAKKQRKSGGFSLKKGMRDERVPKMLGVLFLFFAAYLFVAFSSYLFTWRIDQDSIIRFSWEVFFLSEIEMANWLGRLGAVVSNMFFYWGFGLPSFGVIYLLGLSGLSLIRGVPLELHRSTLRNTLIAILLSSIFLEFLFYRASFPWGGAFGESISLWLKRFLGTLGLLLLFVFLLLTSIVWYVNPDFKELTFQQALTDIRLFVAELLSGRKPKRRVVVVPEPELFDPASDPDEASAELPFPDLDVEGDTDIDLMDDEEEELLLPEEALETALELEQGSGGDDFQGAVVEGNANHIEPYDPTLDLSSYQFPPLELLQEYADGKFNVDMAELESHKDQIIETLLHYKIEIVKIRATVGPTVTLFEIVPAPGVRIVRIKNLEDDIALSLSALGIRIIAPIPGKGTIGIEVPNRRKQIVSTKEVIKSDKFKYAKMDLPIALGKTISNEVFVADLAKMPHLLVAGATGQGKSVGINTILVSLLYKKHPSQVKLVLIDPKKVELFPYARLENHFLASLPGADEPIITETNKVIYTLNSLCIEMDTRYDLLKKAATRNIREYNDKFVQRRLNPEKGHRFLPFIVLIIDEFADLIMTAGKEVEMPIGRLAQLARAVGIHLIIATQRPSVNIITGVIKANFPARIAYKVTSKVDSRTILDAGGADQLIGRGDMLLSVGGEMVRLQGAFIDTPEVEEIIDFIAAQQGYSGPYELPEFHGEEDLPGGGGLKYSDLDEMFEDAARLIVQNQHGSTSMIQRRLKLGYNRAGRIMDQLEAMGVVGPSEGSKAREVLIYDEFELEKFLKELRENG